MFQPRRSEFDPRVSAIVGHLRAIQKELDVIGRKAGRNASANAAAAGDQIAAAIGPILDDLADRFRWSQARASDQAASMTKQAAKIGAKASDAGRNASANAVAAGNQIVEAIAPILDDLADRFRRGQRWTADEAATMANQAVRIGTKAGGDALERVAGQARQRPLVTLAVAIGIGVLIGWASRRD